MYNRGGTTTTTTTAAPFINIIIISNGSYTAANGTYTRSNSSEGFTKVGGNGSIFFSTDAWYIFNTGIGNVAKNTSTLGTGTWEPWEPGNSSGISAQYIYSNTTTTTSTSTSTTTSTSTSTTTTTTTAAPVLTVENQRWGNTANDACTSVNPATTFYTTGPLQSGLYLQDGNVIYLDQALTQPVQYPYIVSPGITRLLDCTNGVLSNQRNC